MAYWSQRFPLGERSRRRTITEASTISAVPVARDGDGLELEHVRCCVCGDDDAVPVAVGRDFEYETSPDAVLAVRCRHCGLLYLNPRPTAGEFTRIYPAQYHAFGFNAERFGIVYAIRRRLEANRLLQWCEGLPARARILDVGCGDGFHLDLLRRYGRRGWELEGIDPSETAVAAGRERGLSLHHGSIEAADLPENAYDAALLIQTIEHVADPPAVLDAIARRLRRFGRLIIVTDNADSLDARLFAGRHWGGYHFPRHWNLFTKPTLQLLAEQHAFRVASLSTIVSPVNWVYSIRNVLVDYHAPAWAVEQFSLRTPLTLGAFTLLDTALSALGRGALLCAVLDRW